MFNLRTGAVLPLEVVLYGCLREGVLASRSIVEKGWGLDIKCLLHPWWCFVFVLFVLLWWVLLHPLVQHILPWTALTTVLRSYRLYSYDVVCHSTDPFLCFLITSNCHVCLDKKKRFFCSPTLHHFSLWGCKNDCNLCHTHIHTL